VSNPPPGHTHSAIFETSPNKERKRGKGEGIHGEEDGAGWLKRQKSR